MVAELKLKEKKALEFFNIGILEPNKYIEDNCGQL